MGAASRPASQGSGRKAASALRSGGGSDSPAVPGVSNVRAGAMKLRWPRVRACVSGRLTA